MWVGWRGGAAITLGSTWHLGAHERGFREPKGSDTLQVLPEGWGRRVDEEEVDEEGGGWMGVSMI